MSLMRIEDLKSLSPLEQEHLQQLEEALQDSLLASALSAKSKALDMDRISRAAITLVLSMAARQVVDIGSEVPASAFGKLAEDALAWARDRGLNAPRVWH